MLCGELTGLRALTDADIEIFEAELLADVPTRVRATGRPWVPVAPGAADSPYRQAQDPAAVVRFSVVELATGDLAGEAVMAGIDLHNRHAEIGLVLRPACRGRHLGTDVASLPLLEIRQLKLLPERILLGYSLGYECSPDPSWLA